jgi:hypothetical protein
MDAVSPGAGMAGTIVEDFPPLEFALVLIAQIAARQTISTTKSVMTMRLAVIILRWRDSRKVGFFTRINFIAHNWAIIASAGKHSDKCIKKGVSLGSV